MECPVCFEAWDLQRVRPKVFAACAHSVCAACVEDLKERQCPTCRQAFADPVLDNFALIAVLESASEDTEAPVLWCLSCKRPSSSQCVVAEHDVKRPKAALRRGLAGLATRCSQQLEGMEADCFQEMQDSHALAALELLDAERAALKLAMTLDDGKVVSSEWRDGDAGASALAKMCLVAAAAKGRAQVQASGEAAAQQSAAQRAPPAPSQPAAQCDVGVQEPNLEQLSQEKLGSKQAEKEQALVFCRQRGVRRIPFFTCHHDRAWSLNVLQQAGHSLEELSLVNPGVDHLGAIRAMPRLQRLQLDGPKVYMSPWPPSEPSSSTAVAGSLKWLRVVRIPGVATWSLLKDFAASLEVVVLGLDRPFGMNWPSGQRSDLRWVDEPWDLETQLRQCGLRRLQRLVLHYISGCSERKLEAARRALPGCTVQCSHCDAAPDDKIW